MTKSNDFGYALFDGNAALVERVPSCTFDRAKREIAMWLKETPNGGGGIYNSGSGRFVQGTTSEHWVVNHLRLPEKECGYTTTYVRRPSREQNS